MGVTNAWSRPLSHGIHAAVHRPQNFVQPINIPFNCQFVPNQVYDSSSQHCRPEPRLAHSADCSCKSHSLPPQRSAANPPPATEGQRGVNTSSATPKPPRSVPEKVRPARLNTSTHFHKSTQEQTPQSSPTAKHADLLTPTPG
jgi:hypothetical protein